MPVYHFQNSRISKIHEESSWTDKWIKHHKDELLKYIHCCLQGQSRQKKKKKIIQTLLTANRMPHMSGVGLGKGE